MACVYLYTIYRYGMVKAHAKRETKRSGELVFPVWGRLIINHTLQLTPTMQYKERVFGWRLPVSSSARSRKQKADRLSSCDDQPATQQSKREEVFEINCQVRSNSKWLDSCPPAHDDA